jgi:hypothetical protein
MEDKTYKFGPSQRNFEPTENVCAWLTGWGPIFSIAAGTQLQNGVDGDTIHEALVSQEGRQNVAGGEWTGVGWFLK